MVKKVKKFKRGTVVVWTPDNFNHEYWKNLSEKDRVKYYGELGYGMKKPRFFVFICDIKNAPGHCILVSLNDQTIETMRHVNEFREVSEEEF